MRDKQTLSIAMCTYNGAQYLQQQLDSIATQTRLPDEMVICDDGSSDTTLQILYKFQSVVPFSVRIYCNEVNLGPTKNFEKAIGLCSGDIIVLSDQDDVWVPYKLEKLEQALEHHPEAGYVFSDAIIVDEVLRPLGYTMWESTSFTQHERRRFKKGQQLEILLRHNVVTGATMAFRGELRSWLLPIPGGQLQHSGWIHDGWISLLLSATGKKGVFVEEPLIYYRQHPRQVIGGLKVTSYERIKWFLLHEKKRAHVYAQSKDLQLLERLTSLNANNPYVKRLIEMKINHLESRQLLYESSPLKGIKLLLREIITGRYQKFSSGWKSIAKDLFCGVVGGSLRWKRG